MTAQPNGEPAAEANADATTPEDGATTGGDSTVLDGHSRTPGGYSKTSDGPSRTSDGPSRTADTESGTGDVPEATLWPSDGQKTGADPETVVVDVYILTGRHGGLRIPESFCRECNLFVRAADVAAERVDRPVGVRVYSWWTRFPWALRHGGYHPPVMVVGGTKLCQGHTVPSPEEVIEAIEAAAATG